MLPQTHHRGRLATLTLAILLALCFTVPSQAQFSVVSMLPADGSENVPTTQPIVLNFNQALDTTQSYGGDEGFFIAAQVAPDPGPPLGYSLNGARTQLTVNVTLAANTQYWIVLVGAKSESGEDLDHPYAWTFSTGALATGSVSGNVTFPESSPENAVVGLFDATFFDSIFNDGEDDGPQFYGLTVAGQDGSFAMNHVPAGTFLPVAFRDVDFDGEPDVSVDGEGLGFHDSDGDRTPDAIVVAGGGSVSDVDVEVHSGRSTSRTNYDAALSVAATVHADAALTGVLGGDMTPEGYSPLWLYSFYSMSTTETMGIASFYDYFLEVDVPSNDDGGPYDPTSALPDNWVDSDDALAAAEAAGGANYRSEYAVFEISAVLFNLDLEATEAGKSQTALEPQPVWIVTYGANDVEPLQLMVDGNTGLVLRNETSELPASSIRLEAYPNPSAGAVSVAFELESTDDVEITVSTLAGQHVLHWDGADDRGLPVATGAYWLRLVTKDRVQSRMVVISH